MEKEELVRDTLDLNEEDLENLINKQSYRNLLFKRKEYNKESKKKQREQDKNEFKRILDMNKDLFYLEFFEKKYRYEREKIIFGALSSFVLLLSLTILLNIYKDMGNNIYISLFACVLCYCFFLFGLDSSLRILADDFKRYEYIEYLLNKKTKTTRN